MSQIKKQDPIKIHKEGTTLYDQGDYRKAVNKFLEASKYYEKVGNMFDASYALFKAAECSYFLKDYEKAIERFSKAADIALEKGYDRFGLSALEYAFDCSKAAGKEQEDEATQLRKRIAETRKKLEAQGF